MRLIDADALKKDIMSYKTMPEIRKAICEVIDNAPAVEYPFYAEAYQTGYEEGKNERPQGDLISRSKAIEELNYLKHIGYDNSGVMKLQNMEIQRCISVIEDVPTIEPFERIGAICNENCGYYRLQEECGKCDYKKFSFAFANGIVEIMSKNGITNVEELLEILRGGAE